MSVTDNLEPPDGDYVRYIERLQSGRAPDLRPLEPPPLADASAAPLPANAPSRGRRSLQSVLESLGGRPAGARSGSGADRERTVARMEASTSTAPAPAPRRPAKLDPALRFASSAFAMFGCMGVLIALDSGEVAPALFGGFAILIAAILLFNGMRAARGQTPSVRRGK